MEGNPSTSERPKETSEGNPVTSERPIKNEGSNDLLKWLKSNKLGSCIETFKKRDVTLEELLEFEKDELNEWSDDIGLDTLSKKRFIKGILQLKEDKKDNQSQSNVSRNKSSSVSKYISNSKPSLKPVKPTKSSLKENEHKLVTKLYQRQLALYNLEQELLNGVKSLDVSYNFNVQKVKKIIESELKTQLLLRKDNMINEIDLVIKNKTKKYNTLKYDINELNKELNNLGNKLHYSDNSYGAKRTVNEIKELLRDNKKIESKFKSIKPEIKVVKGDNITKYLNKNILVSNCDIPYKPKLILKKLKADYVKFEWEDNEQQPKAISETIKYEISYLRIEDVGKNKKEDKKKKSKKKRKKRKKDSHSDSSSDSEESSSGDSSDDSDESGSDSSDSDESSEETEKKEPEKRGFFSRLFGKSNDTKTESRKSSVTSKSSSKHEKVKKIKVKKIDLMSLDVKKLKSSELDYLNSLSDYFHTKNFDYDIETHKFTKLKPESNYIFRCRSKNKNGWSNYSNHIKLKTLKSVKFKWKKNPHITISNKGLTMESTYTSGTYTQSLFGDVISSKKHKIYKCYITCGKCSSYSYPSPYAIGLVEKGFTSYNTQACHTGTNQRCIMYYSCKYDSTGKYQSISSTYYWKQNDKLTVTVDIKKKKFTIHNKRTNETRILENFPDNRILVMETYGKNCKVTIDKQEFI